MTLSEPFYGGSSTRLLAWRWRSRAAAFANLPVAPLPQVAYPTVAVSAALPGASPETMASAVATPLERQFGRIAGVTEMTSSSGLGSTSVVLQFDLSRDIDAAARDVQSAINAASAQLPANLPNEPTYGRSIQPMRRRPSCRSAPTPCRSVESMTSRRRSWHKRSRSLTASDRSPSAAARCLPSGSS